MSDPKQCFVVLNGGKKVHLKWDGQGLTTTVLNAPGSKEGVWSKATLKDKDKLTELVAFFAAVSRDVGL
jgi:hypothetical protein